MYLKVRMFQFKQFQEETAMQFSWVHVDSASNGYIISGFRYRIVDCHLEQARRKLIKPQSWRHKNLTGCHYPCRTYFLFQPEHLRACQEGMKISQLRATITLWWVTCQHWSRCRLEGIDVVTIRIDITCFLKTLPFVSIVLVPKATGMTASALPSFVPVVNSLVWPISTCCFSISFGWIAEICPNASSRVNVPGFGGWYPVLTQQQTL